MRILTASYKVGIEYLFIKGEILEEHFSYYTIKQGYNTVTIYKASIQKAFIIDGDDLLIIKE